MSEDSVDEEQGPYRVGRHQPRNLYRGEIYLGVMFDEADTAMIAQILNRNSFTVPQVPVEDVCPQTFQDGDGDIWNRREDGQYYMYAGGDIPRRLEYIKKTYGAWQGGESE